MFLKAKHFASIAAEPLKDPVAVEQTVIEYTDACFFFIKKGAVDINLSCQKILTSMVWT